MNKKSKSVHERVKYLREEILDIKQNEMSRKINLQSGSLSDIERRKTKIVTDRVIKDICREFNVSEKWLRTGEGEIFETVSKDELDQLAKKYNLNPLAQRLVETFVTLNEEDMNVILSLVNKVSSGLNQEVCACKDKDNGNGVDDIDAELESYRRELEAEKKGETFLASQDGETS